jgi:hypothetical protein
MRCLPCRTWRKRWSCFRATKSTINPNSPIGPKRPQGSPRARERSNNWRHQDCQSGGSSGGFTRTLKSLQQTAGEWSGRKRRLILQGTAIEPRGRYRWGVVPGRLSHCGGHRTYQACPVEPRGRTFCAQAVCDGGAVAETQRELDAQSAPGTTHRYVLSSVVCFMEGRYYLLSR